MISASLKRIQLLQGMGTPFLLVFMMRIPRSGRSMIPPEEQRPIGVWGQRHLRYLRQHRKALYTELQVTGKLNDYLADLNEQAESMFLDLVKQMAEREGVTELLKAQDQMQWVQRMNSIRDWATEIVNNDLIYA